MPSPPAPYHKVAQACQLQYRTVLFVICDALPAASWIIYCAHLGCLPFRSAFEKLYISGHFTHNYLACMLNLSGVKIFNVIDPD